MNNVPSDILARAALDLRCIGIRELAWKYDLVLEVIYELNTYDYLILGGDVYRIDTNTGHISSTGDNWYYSKNCHGSDVLESVNKARDYITNYHARNGEDFCYSVIYEKCKQV